MHRLAQTVQDITQMYDSVIRSVSELQANDNGFDSRTFAVNADDSDMTIRSSDGILFKVHRKNLEAHSEVFSAGEGIINHPGDIVEMEERSEVLELFFQYFYRQRQPELSDLPFSTLADLAEAVEKYEVFSAMTICRDHML